MVEVQESTELRRYAADLHGDEVRAECNEQDSLLIRYRGPQAIGMPL